MPWMWWWVRFLWNSHKFICQLRTVSSHCTAKGCWLTPFPFLSSQPEVWAQDWGLAFISLSGAGQPCWDLGYLLAWTTALLTWAGQVQTGSDRWIRATLAILNLGADLGWGALSYPERLLMNLSLVIKGVNCMVTQTILSAAQPCLHLQLKWSLWDF